jgi:hypothetical protein
MRPCFPSGGIFGRFVRDGIKAPGSAPSVTPHGGDGDERHGGEPDDQDGDGVAAQAACLAREEQAFRLNALAVPCAYGYRTHGKI